MSEFEAQGQATPEEIAAALDLMRRTREQRTKQREKMKTDPIAKAKADLRAKRQRVRQSLLVRKALAAGIVVSEEELEAELAKGSVEEVEGEE
jgi:hypothetical protein